MSTRPEDCGSTLGIRYPSAPSDEWETATCIQEHDGSPGADGTIHDSGDGWKWMLLDGFHEVAPLIVPSADLKALRETLALAQTAIAQRDWEPRARPDIERLGALIQAIDDHRPLGQDGKHGDLHTPTCGCDDR
ncbi:hypothetical protein QDA02_gp23 [Microbacterium phage Margaery]|uniref:Uncharacterized protein n=1 Tax=Microbacterium phage Margaery TaxID=2591217 RepID=A0A514DHQ6_9CAUD|nr:hypothetical protein QDA02_gp23 [Microbacterium phage Margaery]QDH93142.1 hypothetical protein PBI_MARGAERY_85 [Microbacterium phage Margaery]